MRASLKKIGLAAVMALTVAGTALVTAGSAQAQHGHGYGGGGFGPGFVGGLAAGAVIGSGPYYGGGYYGGPYAYGGGPYAYGGGHRPTCCGVAVGGDPPGVPGVALPARYAEAVLECRAEDH
jgi:hypothetical protein